MIIPNIIYKTYIPDNSSNNEEPVSFLEEVKRTVRDISNYQGRNSKRHFKLKNNKDYCLIRYGCVYEDNKLVVVVGDDDIIYIQFDALIDTIGKKIVSQIQLNYCWYNPSYHKPRTLPVVFIDDLVERFGTKVFSFNNIQEKKKIEETLLNLVFTND